MRARSSVAVGASLHDSGRVALSTVRFECAQWVTLRTVCSLVVTARRVPRIVLTGENRCGESSATYERRKRLNALAIHTYKFATHYDCTGGYSNHVGIVTTESECRYEKSHLAERVKSCSRRQCVLCIRRNLNEG